MNVFNIITRNYIHNYIHLEALKKTNKRKARGALRYSFSATLISTRVPRDNMEGHNLARGPRVRQPCLTLLFSSGLPDSGFYPEISGFFEADGIFLGNFFLAKNLGKISGILKKNSCERKNKNNSSNNKSWPIFQTGSRPEPPSC